MTRSSSLILCAVSVLMLCPATAAAGSHGGHSAPTVDVGGLTVWGILGHHRTSPGLGFGVHYMVPVGQGVIQGADVKDQFALEFGADIMTFWYRTASYLRVRPAVGFLWTFWLTDELALYPKIDFGIPLFLFDYEERWHWWFLNLAAGLLYRMDAFDLRVELGWSGLHIGALFRL